MCECSPLLSICIPTYNRSKYLRECISSVLDSALHEKMNVEIVIADNCSTDNTTEVVSEFQSKYSMIRYHRSAENVGGELNFRVAAELAYGKFIWIFGDDDKMTIRAVSRVISCINEGYDLIACNYSTWDKDIAHLIKGNRLNGTSDVSYSSPDELLQRFGLHLGFISCVVMRKDLFLKLPIESYKRYLSFGFPFLFAVYSGIAKTNCKLGYLSEQIILNRSGNSGGYDWFRYFVAGSSLIFDEIQYKGYSRQSIRVAKLQVINEFVMPTVLGLRLVYDRKQDRKSLLVAYTHYKTFGVFWTRLLPAMLIPKSILIFAKIIKSKIRIFK
jgi:abequosyltransferase